MTTPYYRGQNNMANSRWTASKKQRDDEVNRNLLEQDNEAKWLELGEKVSLLKSLSEDINNEVKSQNNLLDQMGDSFSSVSNLFSNTIAFVVLVFLVLYFMMKR